TLLPTHDTPSLPLPPLCRRFSYTTLFRSHRPEDVHALAVDEEGDVGVGQWGGRVVGERDGGQSASFGFEERSHGVGCVAAQGDPDRKSTRLNSSHVSISYAVFCLKKKKKT